MLEIAGRKIGGDAPAYIIAEMSANHGHDLSRATEILQAMKEAGADAAKLQTYTPDTMTINADNEYFRIKGTLWDGRTLYDLYREAYTPWEWHPRLKEEAEAIGLHLFSTPFDISAVDFLETMEVPAYKVASFENIDIPLLQRVGQTGKPVILSTGMASLAEIDEAVTVLRASGANDIVLLKCTSAYPAPHAEMHLKSIPNLAETFNVVAGLSDHTTEVTVPVAAVALGAKVIEKHFTLDRSEPGPDSSFSLEPAEFRAMVNAVRTTEEALGKVRYGPSPGETSSMVFRRSLFVVEDIPAGKSLTRENVRSIRPGYGLHPRHLKEVLGLRAGRDLSRGTPLNWSQLSGGGN